MRRGAGVLPAVLGGVSPPAGTRRKSPSREERRSAHADDEGGHKGRPYQPTESSTGTPACAGESSAVGQETGKSACPTLEKVCERTGNAKEKKG